MKKILGLFILLIVVCTAQAQVLRFQTEAVRLRASTDGLWSEYTPWISSEVQVTIDQEVEMVTINSEYPQRYKINSVGDNPDILELWCTDLKDVNCILQFVKGDLVYELNILYLDLEITYIITQYE